MSFVLLKSFCKDSICIDPKLVLGLNAKGPNNKFVERGYKRTRLTSKEKQLNLTFLRWINTNITIHFSFNQAKFFISLGFPKCHLFRSFDPPLSMHSFTHV